MSPTNPSAFPFKNGDRVHHDGDPLVDKTQVYKSCPACSTWTERQVLRKGSHPSPPPPSVALFAPCSTVEVWRNSEGQRETSDMSSVDLVRGQLEGSRGPGQRRMLQ